MDGLNTPAGVDLAIHPAGDSPSSTVADLSLRPIEETASSTVVGSLFSHDDPEKALPEKALPLRLSRVFEEPSLSPQASIIGTDGIHLPDFEVDWDGDDDPMNPLNWPFWYKGLTVAFMSWSTWVVVVYSTSYTTGISQMMRDLHVSSQPVVTLGITTYLVGLAIGSVILAPLSEMFGRRPVYIVSMLLFLLLMIPCALATSMAEILAVRFLGALAGSVMIPNCVGTLSDIVTDEYRALAFSIWSIGPLNGPTFGPIIGGFSSQYVRPKAQSFVGSNLISNAGISAGDGQTGLS